MKLGAEIDSNDQYVFVSPFFSPIYTYVSVDT